MAKKKILILEDELRNFLHLKSKLKNIYSIFTLKKEHDIVESLNDFPRPDIILMYIEKDETKDYTLLKFLSHSPEYSDIAVIVISEKGSRQDKIKVLTEGAVDYITLPVVPEEVAAKIESIIKYKERCLERHSTRFETELLKSLKNLDESKKFEQFPEENVYTQYNVTLREREIIEMLSKGLLNKEISSTLNVSKRTVEFHINNIYNKFKVKNRIELLKRIDGIVK